MNDWHSEETKKTKEAPRSYWEQTTTDFGSPNYAGRPETGPWDDARARERLAEAYEWAERIGYAGMWSWLWRVGHHRHSKRLDTAFDCIDLAFKDRDQKGLNVALRYFRDVVKTAAAAYKGGSPPGWYGPHPGQPELEEKA